MSGAPEGQVGGRKMPCWDHGVPGPWSRGRTSESSSRLWAGSGVREQWFPLAGILEGSVPSLPWSGCGAVCPGTGQVLLRQRAGPSGPNGPPATTSWLTVDVWGPSRASVSSGVPLSSTAETLVHGGRRMPETSQSFRLLTGFPTQCLCPVWLMTGACIVAAGGSGCGQGLPALWTRLSTSSWPDPSTLAGGVIWETPRKWPVL